MWSRVACRRSFSRWSRSSNERASVTSSMMPAMVSRGAPFGADSALKRTSTSRFSPSTRVRIEAIETSSPVSQVRTTPRRSSVCALGGKAASAMAKDGTSRPGSYPNRSSVSSDQATRPEPRSSRQWPKRASSRTAEGTAASAPASRRRAAASAARSSTCGARSASASVRAISRRARINSAVGAFSGSSGIGLLRLIVRQRSGGRRALIEIRRRRGYFHIFRAN